MAPTWSRKARFTALGPIFSSRLRDQPQEQILANQARATLLEAVRTAPGLTPIGLKRITGFSRNAVIYHLRVLERARAVVRVSTKHRHHFFVRNGGFVNDGKRIVAALRQGRSLELVRLVHRLPGLTHTGLRLALGWSPAAVSWQLRHLIEAQVLESEGPRWRRRYFLSARAQNLDLSAFLAAFPPEGNQLAPASDRSLLQGAA
jgi:predicted transcriptional regulator